MSCGDWSMGEGEKLKPCPCDVDNVILSFSTSEN